LKDWKTMPTSARSRARALPSGERPPVEHDPSGLDGLQAVDRAAQRRLARSGGADDGDHLAPADGEVDVPQDVVLAVVLVDVTQLDQRIGGHTQPYPLSAVSWSPQTIQPGEDVGHDTHFSGISRIYTVFMATSAAGQASATSA
jgi:hypothetical protein